MQKRSCFGYLTGKSFCFADLNPRYYYPSDPVLISYNMMNAEQFFSPSHKSLFRLEGSVTVGSYFSTLVCLMVWSTWLSSFTACTIDAEWCWHTALGVSVFPTANLNVTPLHGLYMLWLSLPLLLFIMPIKRHFPATSQQDYSLIKHISLTLDSLSQKFSRFRRIHFDIK